MASLFRVITAARESRLSTRKFKEKARRTDRSASLLGAQSCVKTPFGVMKSSIQTKSIISQNCSVRPPVWIVFLSGHAELF